MSRIRSKASVSVRGASTPARGTSTRGLTEGAIQAALVTVLALGARYVPLLAVVTTFLIPLPLAVLVIRHGIRPAVLAAVVAGLIAGALAGPLTGFGILATVAPLGIVLGLGARAGRSAPALLGMLTLVSVAALLLNLVLTLALADVNPYQVMIESMRRGQEASEAFYRRLGIPPEQLEATSRQVRQVLALMPRLIPVLVVLGGVMSAWINYQVARAVLGRLGYTLPALPPASTWRLPAYVLWLLPAGLLLTATAGPVRPPEGETAPPMPLPAVVGLNILYGVQMAFAAQGILVAWVALRRYILLPFLRVVILLFVVLNPVLGVVVTLAGMADSVFRLRERLDPSLARSTPAASAEVRS